MPASMHRGFCAVEVHCSKEAKRWCETNASFCICLFLEAEVPTSVEVGRCWNGEAWSQSMSRRAEK